MLTPEQAKERLEQARDPGWEARCLGAIEALPEPARGVGWFLMGRDFHGNEVNGIEAASAHAAQGAEAARRLEALPESDRKALWAVFFPRLDSGLVERAWRSLAHWPYQAGWQRKPFRAPGDATVVWGHRMSWIEGLIASLAEYNPDLEWVAAWLGHATPYRSDGVPLLVAAIDAGGPAGEAVLQTLRESASGTHEIGVMGHHVPRALLSAANPEGWEFVQKLLLAAQRQEGLRQSILEAIDEGHPAAFRRMLRLILDEDLARFSATVRALNTWFGFAWDSVSVKVVNGTIERVLRFLDEADARAAAIASGPAEDAYLALWSIAYEDALAAIDAAAGLLDDADVGRRFVAVHLLGQLGLPARTLPHLLRAFDDADLRVALHANAALMHARGGAFAESALFEHAERLLARLPAKPETLEPIVWPWQQLSADRHLVSLTLLNGVGSRPPTRLVPHMPAMDSWRRAQVVRSLIEADPHGCETRELLLKFAADASSTVRDEAIEGLAKSRITPEEAERIEPLLTRKSDGLRQGVLSLLLNQEDDAALASADRLLTSRKDEARLAGLELLRRLAEAGRRAEDCRARAASYRDGRKKATEAEDRQLQAILDAGRKVPTLDDALGLLDPGRRTRPVAPVAHDRPWFTTAALRCVGSLAALIHEHREVPVRINHYASQEREELLGNIRWHFPAPDPKAPAAEDAARLPLREVWESWWAARPDDQRDRDGLELVRALAMVSMARAHPDQTFDRWCFPGGLWEDFISSSMPTTSPTVLAGLLFWLTGLHPAEGAADFLLDATETGFARVPQDELAWVKPPQDWQAKPNWRDVAASPYTVWLQMARHHRHSAPSGWTGAHHARLFRLLRWMDEPGPAVPRHRPMLHEVLLAHDSGGATLDDLFDQLLGPVEEGQVSHRELMSFSGRRPTDLDRQFPILRQVVDRCRERIVEVELDRGEAPTAASQPALSIRWISGADTLMRLLVAMRETPFNRRVSVWSADASRSSVLSHLIRATTPAEEDTPAAFAAEVKRRGIPESRLVELAVFAPQWARFIEQALGWPQLEEAAWWLRAHTKGTDWSVDAELREAWTAEVAARTSLAAADLLDGAVDVAWFLRVYKGLGPKRWPAVDEAARFVSSGAGHARARLFASAMLGKAKKSEVLARVKGSRHADSLRALGLLPLARGAARERDLLDRYKVIQEFLRTSKQFGAMRQASEKRAAAIAMDNLARTAGYADPIRLEWAMESRAVADLVDGPVSVEVDGVTVSLAIDAQGRPELTARRGARPLKSIPPAVKKNKKVAGLVERAGDLKRQASRVRQSLEAAMCRGDAFTGDELRSLAAHAVLAPLLGRLVLIGEGIAGYPVEGGRALRDHAGRLEPVKPVESLRIAHPHDLLGLGDWHLWQHECFAAERVQPFKQVFRELYVLTEAERAEPARSLRYAGHQVNPRQALALLGGRGWVNHPDEGVRRTFHEAGLTARLGFLGGVFTPAEVEGLTVEDVEFVKRGEWKPLPLAEVPPRLFSEVMRDLDLVVSVAHRGGVDPEASASTVEMRGNLLRETCELLGIGNVRIRGTHAMIDGELGQYSLHMGSGVVHRQPGGALCIVPVHAQHRGRLFLPFADDDPRTAEVLSKALLLARDGEIQDPTILAQIRTVR